MLTLNGEPGMRRGRIFLRDGAEVTAELRTTDPPVEEDDRARHGLLRDVFRGGVVRCVAHPGADVDATDVVDVYVTLPWTQEPVFACVVVSEARLERMLVEAPIVVEDLHLQVASTGGEGSLTPSALRAALGTWAGRVFPGTTPEIDVAVWSDTGGSGWRDRRGIR